MGHFKFVILFSFLIALGATGKISGQNYQSIQSVKAIDDFLRAEDVHLQMDGEENLWITTPVKVLKYNSAEVVEFNKFKGIPKEIGNQFIATYADFENKVWLAGEQGIALYDPETESFKFVSSSTGKVYAMHEDERNQLWIAAENGIFKLKTNSSDNDYSLSRFLSENTVAASVLTIGNNIVFAGPNGILTINLISGKFDRIDLGFHKDINITSVLPVDDFVLLGTKEHGLYKTDYQLKNIQKVYTLPYTIAQQEITGLETIGEEIVMSTKGSGLVRLTKNLKVIEEDSGDYPKQISVILLDNKDLLWIVSSDGLYLKNFSSNAVKKLYHDPARYSSLADNTITAAARDSRGNIWFGHSKGLSIWDTNTDRWRHIENLNFKRNLKSPDDITDLVANGEHMWVATTNDGVYKINISTLLRAHYSIDALYRTGIQSATSLFIDSDDGIWIGGKDGDLTQVKANNQIREFPLKNVNAIAELGPKQIIVSAGTKMYSLNPVTGRIKDLELLSAGEEFPYYEINDIKITQDAKGLFATEGAGLIIYDFEKDSLQLLNENNGIPSRNIEAVEIVSDNEFWLATDRGAVYYNLESGTTRVFSEINGLSSSSLTTDFLKIQDDSYVLGSKRGINIFKPREMLAQQDFTPRLELESINILSKNKEPEKIFLAEVPEVKIFDNSSFKINFQALSHLNPGDIQYSWKLEGFDDEWTEASTLNTANYASLPPGNYNFMVRTRLGEQDWSSPQEFSLNVVQHAGSVSAVYLFVGLSILAMIIIFVVVFLKRSKAASLQAKAELREKLQEQFKAPVEKAVSSLSKISENANSGEDLQRYAARFDELFNQILNFNYEESGYEISKIDVHSHISRLIENLKPMTSTKELEVILNDQWGGVDFYYNGENLDKIILSLVSASANYSLKGGKIIINIIETSVGDLKLQITDNGRGIPDSQIRLLERKTDLKYATVKERKGIYHIVQARDFIQNHGGSFSLESEENEGSTFIVVLKNRKTEYRKVPKRAAQIFKAEKSKTSPTTEFPSEITGFSDSKVLIVENDTVIRDLLVMNIGKYCQVYQAQTAEEVIEKAGMIFPDIIISGMVLSDINAFQLSKMIKRNIELNHISLMLVAEEDQVLAGDHLLGISEIIRKPVDINLLLTKLVRILSWQKELRTSYKRSYIENIERKYRSEADERFISYLIDQIIQNIRNENFTVHDLSAKVGVSSNTLFMKLKNLVDMSPQDFMEFTRLNYARQLLQKGELNVMEVAYKSGFSSPTLFYSSFKKFFGYSLTDSVEKEP